MPSQITRVNSRQLLVLYVCEARAPTIARGRKRHASIGANGSMDFFRDEAFTRVGGTGRLACRNSHGQGSVAPQSVCQVGLAQGKKRENQTMTKTL